MTLTIQKIDYEAEPYEEHLAREEQERRFREEVREEEEEDE